MMLKQLWGQLFGGNGGGAASSGRSSSSGAGSASNDNGAGGAPTTAGSTSSSLQPSDATGSLSLSSTSTSMSTPVSQRHLRSPSVPITSQSQIDGFNYTASSMTPPLAFLGSEHPRIVRAATISSVSKTEPGGAAGSPSDRVINVATVVTTGDSAASATTAPLMAATTRTTSPSLSPGIQRLRTVQLQQQQRQLQQLAQQKAESAASEDELRSATSSSCSTPTPPVGDTGASVLRTPNQKTLCRAVRQHEKHIRKLVQDGIDLHGMIVDKRKQLSHLRPNVNTQIPLPSELAEALLPADLESIMCSDIQTDEEREIVLTNIIKVYREREASISGVNRRLTEELAKINGDLHGARIRTRTYDSLVANGNKIAEYSQRVENLRQQQQPMVKTV